MPEQSTNTKSRRDKFLDMFGPIASPLRRNFILATVILASAIVTVCATRVGLVDGRMNPRWVPWIVGMGIAAAVAVLLDRIADSYDGRASNEEYQGSEFTAESSVTELNVFLSEIIEVSYLSGNSRRTALGALRRHLVRSAANSIGPGSRATYYTLERSTPGERVLGSPEHFVTVGRGDKPARPFRELESPGHDVWKLIDNVDENPDVLNAPDHVNDLDWSRRPYDTFLSIPVKAKGKIFGMLSVNNATAGAIGRTQRAAIIAMARAYAAAMSLETSTTPRHDDDSEQNVVRAG